MVVFLYNLAVLITMVVAVFSEPVPAGREDLERAGAQALIDGEDPSLDRIVRMGEVEAQLLAAIYGLTSINAASNSRGNSGGRCANPKES